MILSLQWEDGVVDVPVQRPTQEAISEWIPENTKGGGHATEEKACTSLSDHHVAEDAFFQGRQVRVPPHEDWLNFSAHTQEF